MSVPDIVQRRLAGAGIDARELGHLIDLALDEDLRYGPDVTSEATIASDAVAVGDVVARERGVLCGVPVALAVFAAVDLPLSGVNVTCEDGNEIEKGTVVLRVRGPLRQLLLAERSALNFMTHLSGIATTTRAWVRALEGTGCVVRDTRKTTPGLRQLEKYAVRCGGGENHRMGLGDAALLKDNHVAATGSITRAVEALRALPEAVELEVECDTLEQVREALQAGCTLILLDNMDIDEIRCCVELARPYPGVRLEASGGITLAGAREVAATGVDYLAVGALTHSSPALDLGLDLHPAR